MKRLPNPKIRLSKGFSLKLLRYIRKKLASQQDVDNDNLRSVNEDLKKQIISLQNIINEQNNELERYKN